MSRIKKSAIFLLLIMQSHCFSADSIVSLNGSWEYLAGFNESYLKSPDNQEWKNVVVPVDFREKAEFSDYTGYVTLRKKIPSEIQNRQDGPLALFFSQLCDISSIYINTKKIATLGSIEPYRSGMFRTFLGNISEHALYKDKENYIYVVLYSKKDFPLYIAGPEMDIGISEKIFEKYYLQEIFSLSFIAVYFIVGLYHLLLFFNRRKEKEYLFFAVTCIVMATYFINRTGSRMYFFSDEIFRAKFEFISLYGFMSFLLFFTSWLFYKKLSRFTIAYSIFAGALSLITVFSSYSAASKILSIFQLSFLIYLPYVLYIIINQTIKKNPDALRLLIGSIILSICAIHDLMVARDYFNNINISKYGFFIFILGIAAMLARRFTRAYDEADRLNDEMKIKNMELHKSMLLVKDAKERLEEKVAERTSELQKAYVKLKETDAVKTSFFANITHEIRTPLTLIMASLDRMKNDDSIKTSYGIDIQTMRNNSLRLIKLITQILEMAKIDSSEIEIHPVSIDIKIFVQDIANQFLPLAESRGLYLNFNCSFNDYFLITDSMKLETILMNLLSNAFKFTDEGGIDISLEKQNNGVCITVKDTGIGIASEYQNKIFERFIQVDQGSSRKYEGTGIGLAIAAEFAKILDGELTLESIPGKGSSFKLKIPSLAGSPALQKVIPDTMIKEQFLAELEIDALPVSQKIFRENVYVVLVVEDNLEMRNHIASVLYEYNIFTASNGMEAIECIKEHNVDLIVSDIMMPEMDGFELILKLDRDPDLRHIPLVFITALADAQNRFRGLYSGAVYYLSKPFVSEELKAAVSSALKRSEILKGSVNLERQKLYEDIHDNLGSQITDLLILADTLQKRELLPKEKHSLLNTAKNISDAVRGQLQNYERLVMLNQDFCMGLQLTLLDRYSLQNRILLFETEDEISQILSKPGNRKIAGEIYSVCMEIASNDLKYGKGPSTWSLKPDTDKKNISLSFSALSTHEGISFGYGTGNISSRISRLNGDLNVKHDNEYSITIHVPLAV